MCSCGWHGVVHGPSFLQPLSQSPNPAYPGVGCRLWRHWQLQHEADGTPNLLHARVFRAALLLATFSVISKK